MEYACIACIGKGARCRNLLEDGRTLCVLHEKISRKGKLRIAPRPKTVIVKFKINLGLANKLQNAGIRHKKINWEEKERRHREQALEYRRNPYILRKGEKADAGVLVFGKKGLLNVSLASIWRELKEKDYKLVDIYLSSCSYCSREMRILWVNFSLFENRDFFIEKSAKKQIENLFLSVYEFCHVWVNPPDLVSKNVVHTVNVAHRLVRTSPNFLIFKEGLWGLNGE